MGAIDRCVRNKPSGQSAATWLSLPVALLVLVGCRQVANQAGVPERESGRASYADAINKIAPAVVSIYTYTKVPVPRELREPLTDRIPLTQLKREAGGAELQGLGSGVLTSSDGYILTTGHVVERAEKITAVTADGQELEASVVGVDPATDLAVLKVRARNMPRASFGDSSRLRVGDVVLAVGNSFGVGQTVTSGIVSATERSGFGVMDFENFIQTDAPINPGNSGGALADSHGRVIGISSAILTSGGGSEGIGFAIPINTARGIMRELITHGKVVRGYLGVSVRPLTTDLARAFNIPLGKGAFVVEVDPGSPAARAGVQEGDIIVQVNGRRVDGSGSFRMQVAGSRPGTKLQLNIVRVGRQQAITAQLEEPPGSRHGVRAVGAAAD